MDALEITLRPEQVHAMRNAAAWPKVLIFYNVFVSK